MARASGIGSRPIVQEVGGERAVAEAEELLHRNDQLPPREVVERRVERRLRRALPGDGEPAPASANARAIVETGGHRGERFARRLGALAVARYRRRLAASDLAAFGDLEDDVAARGRGAAREAERSLEHELDRLNAGFDPHGAGSYPLELA